MRRFSKKKHYTRAELIEIIQGLQGKRNSTNEERIGFFDIETSNLNADYGLMFCYCIKDSLSNKIYETVITKKQLSTCLDRQVVTQCIDDIQKFDRLVTFYGARFDVPFLRARALYHGIQFPKFGSLFHTDCYDIVKRKVKLSSRRLENCCNVLLAKRGGSHKTRLDPVYWLKALMGDKKSLEYIVHHCRADVADLEVLYNEVKRFVRCTKTSI